MVIALRLCPRKIIIVRPLDLVMNLHEPSAELTDNARVICKLGKGRLGKAASAIWWIRHLVYNSQGLTSCPKTVMCTSVWLNLKDPRTFLACLFEMLLPLPHEAMPKYLFTRECKAPGSCARPRHCACVIHGNALAGWHWLVLCTRHMRHERLDHGPGDSQSLQIYRRFGNNLI